MAKLYTARQVGEELGLPHLEVIRRIRRGDIQAKKLGWHWVIEGADVEAAKLTDWYRRHQERQASISAAE